MLFSNSRFFTAAGSAPRAMASRACERGSLPVGLPPEIGTHLLLIKPTLSPVFGLVANFVGVCDVGAPCGPGVGGEGAAAAITGNRCGSGVRSKQGKFSTGFLA
jgi:hypothetical protein